MMSPSKKRLDEVETALETLIQNAETHTEQYDKLMSEKDDLMKSIKAVPFIDAFDLRYNYLRRQLLPSTNAVMFCIMDVSGSMDETKKEMAKKFFILLYLFLNRNYEKIDVVFIRHHTSAKEVNEDEFFYSRETGGTVVSSSLEMMYETIQARYPSDCWNIYAAQASDGDNWNADSPYCQELLLHKIMPNIKYFAYVEILPRHHQSLWHSYLSIKDVCKNFSMQCINNPVDIYPVFRELFKRTMQ